MLSHFYFAIDFAVHVGHRVNYHVVFVDFHVKVRAILTFVTR